MGFGTKKTEGGHKSGHSNMVHYTGTEEIKAETKKVRRQQSKTVIASELSNLHCAHVRKLFALTSSVG